jgi:hypothetical protein
VEGGLHGESEEGQEDDEESQETDGQQLKDPSHRGGEEEEDVLVGVQEEVGHVLNLATEGGGWGLVWRGEGGGEEAPPGSGTREEERGTRARGEEREGESGREGARQDEGATTPAAAAAVAA